MPRSHTQTFATLLYARAHLQENGFRFPKWIICIFIDLPGNLGKKYSK